LLKNMELGRLPKAEIHSDIKDLSLKGVEVDIITAGFPCQDISVLGTGAGLAGERSGLFFEIIRLVKEARPAWVFLENVPAIRTRGLKEVVRSFADMGYDCRWTCVSAKEIGACHIRKRWFMLARGHNLRLESGWIKGQTRPKEKRESGGESQKGLSSDSYGERLEGRYREKQTLPKPCGYGGQVSKPSLCRGAHGLRNRVDRIKGLGNAVVPLQAQVAFERLMGLEK